ncbi:MAG: hypothetical protein PHT69_11655 [Bacteroidales bacterium]|nr:hypothetical protein [Bacteroidales bacterium]
MAKREINVFSISFLDLLSGALAAVIILFVVIPKMTNQQATAIETLDSLEVQVEELDSLISLARNSIPTEVFEQIQRQVSTLTQTVNELQRQVAQLEEDLRNCRESQQQLQQQLEETQQRLREALERIEQLEEIEQRDPTPPTNNTGPGRVLFGVDAKFAIVITWPDNIDVDLHIVNSANGEKVWYNNLRTEWGVLHSDVTSNPSGEDIFELFYQKEVVPGNYEIYYKLYTTGEQSVSVSGYVSIFPFTAQEHKVELPVTTIRNADDLVRIGTVNLTNTSFTFN